MVNLSVMSLDTLDARSCREAKEAINKGLALIDKLSLSVGKLSSSAMKDYFRDQKLCNKSGFDCRILWLVIY